MAKVCLHLQFGHVCDGHVPQLKMAEEPARGGTVTRGLRRRVALQVLRTNVVIGADDAALEDGEIALTRVRVCVATHIFTDVVVDDRMIEVTVHVAILTRIVGHQASAALSGDDS
jgi:hypothetical protein